MAAEKRNSRSIFICGLSSEIGQKLVDSLADPGTRLFLTDTSQETLENIEKKIAGKTGELHILRVDNRDAYLVEDAVYKAFSSFGSFDCFINNFSLPSVHTNIIDCSLDYWNRAMTTNLSAVFLHMKYELLVLIGSQKKGLIVNTFSSKNKISLDESQAAVTFLFGMKGFMQILSDTFKNKAIKIVSFFKNETIIKNMSEQASLDVDLQTLSTTEREIMDKVRQVVGPVGWVV